MDQKLLNILKNTIDEVVDGSSCSIDFISLDLNEENPTMDCLSKSGERISVSFKN